MNIDQQAFYDQEVNDFLKHKQLYGEVDKIGTQFIKDQIQDRADKVLLDYGCGGGKIAIEYAKSGVGRVMGVDISKEMIANALQTSKGLSNIDFMSIDPQNTIFDSAVRNDLFDYVVSHYVFCTIADTQLLSQIITTLYRVMKDGGQLFTLMPNRDSFNGRVSYGFSCVYKPDLQEGDEVVTYLRTNDSPLPVIDDLSSSHLRITDFFMPQDRMKSLFEDAGFRVRIHEIIIPDETYEGVIDEKAHSPIYVLEAKKDSD